MFWTGTNKKKKEKEKEEEDEKNRSSWKATTCLLDLFFRKEKVRKGEKEVKQVKAEAVREK